MALAAARPKQACLRPDRHHQHHHQPRAAHLLLHLLQQLAVVPGAVVHRGPQPLHLPGLRLQLRALGEDLVGLRPQLALQQHQVLALLGGHSGHLGGHLAGQGLRAGGGHVGSVACQQGA